MHYDARINNHGLPRDPFKAIVAPRPIGWISSLSREGVVNLAPYSYFNGVSSQPPIVCFGSEGHKDSISNVVDTGEFVCNLVTYALRDAMNLTSAPFAHGIDEMAAAGLEPAPSRFVKPPRVKNSPCALECKLLQTVRLSDVDGNVLDRHVVFGQVVGVYIEDRFIKQGFLDTAAMHPIARCGYHEYAAVNETFTLVRPKDAGSTLPREKADAAR